MKNRTNKYQIFFFSPAWFAHSVRIGLILFIFIMKGNAQEIQIPFDSKGIIMTIDSKLGHEMEVLPNIQILLKRVYTRLLTPVIFSK